MPRISSRRPRCAGQRGRPWWPAARCGVVGPDGLRKHISSPGRFHDSTHGATGDDAGTAGGGLEHDATSAELAKDFMGRVPSIRAPSPCSCERVQWPCAGFRDFLSLAEAESYVPVTIANDHQGAEAEATTAFHDFGNPVQETIFSMKPSSFCSMTVLSSPG